MAARPQIIFQYDRAAPYNSRAVRKDVNKNILNSWIIRGGQQGSPQDHLISPPITSSSGATSNMRSTGEYQLLPRVRNYLVPVRLMMRLYPNGQVVILNVQVRLIQHHFTNFCKTWEMTFSNKLTYQPVFSFAFCYELHFFYKNGTLGISV